ncbi:hypothetical protein [Psychroserpens sp. SPM9]|uniref:hypothetical protein n=1 Tax=Psychroserpens sp. SPM9 TaxID=2975598 RepID=UPI0021A2E2BD|nr:hypothetical protein [Psychroserpens sp. SPM9]MDG5490681.1 hypothetical protein [Psychroserpens sp. SPM9]
MIRKSHSLLLIVILLITGCDKRKPDVIDDSETNMYNLNELRQEVYLKGNIESYNSLKEIYLNNVESDFLPYAMIMANKFNNTNASYDTFELLISIDGCSIDYNLSCVDESTRDLALSYLVNAINKGHKVASEILIEFYSKDKSYPIGNLYLDKNLMNKAKSNIIDK